MKAVLICPSERPALSRLAAAAPLSVLPILGQGLAEHWLEHLAALGAKEVRVLAADRPEQTRAWIGDGARWGLRVEVTEESRELTPVEARARCRREKIGWLADPNDAVLMDHLPGLPEQCLLESYSHWFAGVLAGLARVASPLRVGMREIEPGVWAGLRTRIAPSARLHPPCWLGHQVWIGPEAVLGPGVVVEDRVFIETGATVLHSVVGTETFLGRLTHLEESIAWGSTLVNWRTCSVIEVAEPFLLGPLRRHGSAEKVAKARQRWSKMGLKLLALPTRRRGTGRSPRRVRTAPGESEAGLRIALDGGVLRISHIEQLAAAAAESFRRRVRAALRDETLKGVEIDFSQTRLVDNCGLGVLMAIREFVSSLNGNAAVPVRLLNPIPPVQQLLDLTRLHHAFEIVKQ